MGLSGVRRGGVRWLAGCVVVALLGGVWPLVSGAGAVPARSVSGVSVSGGGDGVLLVSWEAPGELPTDYRVAWAREDLDFLSYSAADEAERGNAYPAGDATSLRLEGLSAGATYKVLVRARYGTGGPGPWSEQATGEAGESEDETEDGSDSETEGGSEGGTENEAEGGSAGGTEGAGFAMAGVLEVGSSPYGDLTLWGFSTRSAGMGSFEIISVGDPADERQVGRRGFVAGLLSAPGTLSFGGFGPFDDAVVMMSPQMATPFVVEIDGRRYGSDDASLANGRGQSFRFWVWEDPCAGWADGDSLDVTFSPGPYSDAALDGTDTALASLALQGAVLDQGFDPAAADYSAAAEDGVTQITVDAAPADANACGIDITPADADPAAEGHQIDIHPDNGAAVTVTVTAADQTATASYTVTVAPPEGALPAAAADMGLDGIDIDYQPHQQRYHATVPSTLRSTTVDVRTAPGTTARSVAYQPPDTTTPPHTTPPRGWAGALSRRALTRSTADDGPSSQNADGTFDLASDRDTLVVTRVSTPQSERETLYTARLRPAGASRPQVRSTGIEPRLSALTVTPGTLAPAFAAATFSYDIAVAHDTGTVTVAATAAKGTTARVVAADADPDTSGHQVALNPSTAQRSAQTAFIVLVTAGTRIDSYTVTVTRSATPARLSSLSVSPAPLSPAFAADTTSYSGSVTNEHAHVTVAANAPAGVDVSISLADADPDTSGHQIALNAAPEPYGLTPVSSQTSFTVTATVGDTSHVYTVTIERYWWNTGSEPTGTDFPKDHTTPGRVQVGASVTGDLPDSGHANHFPAGSLHPSADFYLTSNDFDWYAVDLEAGQRYRFDLKSWWRDDPDLSCGPQDAVINRIVDAAGNTQPNTFNDDWGGASYRVIFEDARTYFTPDADGTYYVEVTALSTHRSRYRLSVNADDGSDVAASIASVARATVDTPYRGVIEHASDLDWVGVQLTAGTRYTISATSPGPSDRGIGSIDIVRVRDQAGNSVGGVSMSYWFTGSPYRTYNESATFTPRTSGLYFVEVQGGRRLFAYHMDHKKAGTYDIAVAVQPS